MAQRKYRYSLKRRDSKLAGVCSTIGDRFGIDPTIIRIGFAAAALLISWEVALVTYVAAGIYFGLKKRKSLRGEERRSDFERMGLSGRGRTSVHDLRTTLDESDRRMMAIDHHLNRHNDELAREIEALRGEKS